MKAYVYLLLIVLATACDQILKSPVSFQSEVDELSISYYPTTHETRNDTLFVKYTLPETDYKSHEKQNLIREKYLLRICEWDQIKEINYLVVWSININDSTEYEEVGFYKEYALDWAKSMPSDSLWNIWSDYLIKNVNGQELSYYNTFIRSTIRDSRYADTIATDNQNLIYFLDQYSDECRGNSNNVKFGNMLKIVDTLSIWASKDSVLWMGNYNPRILNRFFCDCDSIKRKRG
jgi:hypothetical protein